MGAQPEPLSIRKASDSTDAAPEIEYRMVTHDSLSMFLTAIGGAILGMLLTLLVLALVNGGTLSFSGPRITQLEEYVNRVDENVGSVSANINLVSEQAAALQQQLGSVETVLRNELATQGGDFTTLNDSVETLQVTRQQFGYFMGALNAALTDMQLMDPSVASVAPAAEEAPAEMTAAEEAPAVETDVAADPEVASMEVIEIVAPQVIQSADVATDTIAVLLFVDEDGDGMMGASETNLIGLSVSLLDSAGEAVDTKESDDAGVFFADLAAGEYQVSVDDTLGYALLSEAAAAVTLAEDAEEGHIIYIPVVAE